MNLLKSFTFKYTGRCISILKSLERELPETISSGICSTTRKFHGDNNKNTSETKELKTTEKIFQINGAVVRLPDSYFYMKVSDHSRRFDAKPPGTHLESGAIKKKPSGTKLGRLRAIALVVTLIYMGGQLSSLGARMLHEFEIFSLPDEDDE